MRDHAGLLAEALRPRGISCSLHWLRAARLAARGSRGGPRLDARLAAELDEGAPDAVLLHYSVFSYSHRGVPLFVHPTLLARCAARGHPLIAVMHEFAYPWRLGGARGKVWALTQRALLLERDARLERPRS